MISRDFFEKQFLVDCIETVELSFRSAVGNTFVMVIAFSSSPVLDDWLSKDTMAENTGKSVSRSV